MTASGRAAVGATALALVALAYLIESRRYALDTLAAPGPGVFPVCAGGLLLVLALWQLGRARRGAAPLPDPHAAASSAAAPSAARAAAAGPDALSSLAEPAEAAMHVRPRRSGPLTMVGVLTLYVVAIGWLGFFASTFVVVIVSSRLLGAPDWRRPVALAVGVVVVAWVLFAAWLKVPLPAGWLR